MTDYNETTKSLKNIHDLDVLCKQKGYNQYDLNQIDVSTLIELLLYKGELDETVLIESLEMEIINKQLEKLSARLSCSKEQVICKAIALYEIACNAPIDNKKIALVDDKTDYGEQITGF
ncbi:hypothetical protein CDG76_12380 [Nostoc sp. 'Peltigera membranacea cyanobiont' 210A]|uniref:hypothetical protein n=1 Tax=Nostoc sp. 'Peltigera membranacea cyanobiont' 210A TaxID=2014529 RepID=UPI000B9569C7|nr:hypothetical protein [Nostoc sp. 'Peltigera membranacea cyanobiont' 210A]OYD95723.1 hypothetical protein CDG76_12380 [Nostoc sp. 'Peltigera membranacea cyanobiont' 210A]